ncbi:A-kinase-interacting protein 1 isoform X2 [Rhinatrema bivittatum]|uniref:A-kinase-interacting protein 1 isoform X2 n=1 Tax=Rhinatrema bivittatum TaxID=194408 RepID=UPI00112C0D67|nr:A-kinase-interacting protein 1 isoform X2 [Rhinatrema bivittatum]
MRGLGTTTPSLPSGGEGAGGRKRLRRRRPPVSEALAGLGDIVTDPLPRAFLYKSAAAAPSRPGGADFLHGAAMDTNYTWMKRSLERTARLGLEVLQRAKNREVTWPAVTLQTHFREAASQGEDKEGSTKQMEAEADYPGLESSFATIAEFMARTTEQCEKYYNNLPASNCSTNEMNHGRRYHDRTSVQRFISSPVDTVSDKTFAATLIRPAHKRNPSKSYIFEGTCNVTECPQDSWKERHVEDFSPGQSVDLAFTV